MAKRLSFDECWDIFKKADSFCPNPPFSFEPRDRPQQTYSEFKLLYDYVEKLRPKSVMEIGTYVGGTLRFWINVAQDDAKIIAVERYPDVSALVPTWQSWLKGKQQLHLINKDSYREREAILSEVKEVLGKTKDEQNKLDFLFIDGEHMLPMAQSDFETYAPLVRGGGIIAFHDIAPPPLNTFKDLWLYWYNLKLNLAANIYINTVEIIGRHRTTGISGIGILLLDDDVELNEALIKFLKTGKLGA